jgi:hypothetical protein
MIHLHHPIRADAELPQLPLDRLPFETPTALLFGSEVLGSDHPAVEMATEQGMGQWGCTVNMGCKQKLVSKGTI